MIKHRNNNAIGDRKFTVKKKKQILRRPKPNIKCVQVSISSTLNARIFHTTFFYSYILALNELLYEKFACLTLMKLTAAVVKIMSFVAF